MKYRGDRSSCQSVLREIGYEVFLQFALLLWPDAECALGVIVLYRKWEHWRSLEGDCPICGAPSHVAVRLSTGRVFWMHNTFERHNAHSLAPISPQVYEHLVKSAKARGLDPAPSVDNARSKQVQCVETGEVFSSMTEASKAYGASRGAVSSAILRGGTCAGKHWKRI